MSGRSYATVGDITALGVSLTASQMTAAETLLETASAALRLTAKKYGKNLEAMLADEIYGDDYASVVKKTVIQATLRALNSITDTAPAVTQTSQSGLGYSATATYLNAGQSLYFLKNELKELGLMQQRYGGLEVYDIGTADKRDDHRGVP